MSDEQPTAEVARIVALLTEAQSEDAVASSRFELLEAIIAQTSKSGCPEVRELAGFAVDEKCRLLVLSGSVPGAVESSEELLQLFRSEVEEAAIVAIAGHLLIVTKRLLSKQARVANGQTGLRRFTRQPKWVSQQAIKILEALRERLGGLSTESSEDLLGQVENQYGAVLAGVGRNREAASAWQRAIELGQPIRPGQWRK